MPSPATDGAKAKGQFKHPMGIKTPAICTALLLSAFSALMLSGCASMSGSGSGSNGAGAAKSGLFAWENMSYEAVGTGTVPANASLEPQRSIVGTQAAKTSAISSLKQEVTKLNVTPTMSLGELMRENLAVKRGTEKFLQGAQVVEEKEVKPGTFEVRVRASMVPLANMLRQNNITPNGLPPSLPADENPAPRTL
ncbi:MAG: hypothetical protein K1X53_15450 [Candidatus Sumerlaeaceae bacterium]|nr:hypothetical protein [Candidatus Sumerlaeaceae bacterium]